MKNFKQGRSRSYVCYLRLKNDIEKFNELKISITYTLGGRNYFTGSTNPRGYKIFLKPVSRSGCVESSILLGSGNSSGYYISIESASRFNARRLEELAKKFDDKVEVILDCFESENKGKMFLIVKGETYVEQTNREAVSQTA